MPASDLKMLVEALVFAADEPLRPERLAEVLDLERNQVLAVLHALVADYRQRPRGFVLVEVAGGFQFRTRPQHAEAIRRLLQSRPSRLSRAALETLAIIAYRQPLTRGEVDYLRGVDSAGVIRTLLEKHLVKILGKKEVPGRPLTYGTTPGFLALFGLRALSDLPTLREFSELEPAGEVKSDRTPSLFESGVGEG